MSRPAMTGPVLRVAWYAPTLFPNVCAYERAMRCPGRAGGVSGECVPQRLYPKQSAMLLCASHAKARTNLGSISGAVRYVPTRIAYQCVLMRLRVSHTNLGDVRYEHGPMGCYSDAMRSPVLTWGMLLPGSTLRPVESYEEEGGHPDLEVHPELKRKQNTKPVQIARKSRSLSFKFAPVSARSRFRNANTPS
eukprot:3941977-Rhodomonas_salina.2